MTGITERNTMERSRGRWVEILQAFGVSGAILNKKQQPCPMCGGTDRFIFDNKFGDGNYFCRGCGSGDGMQLLMHLKGWPFRQAADEVDKIIGNLPSAEAAFSGTQSANPRSLRVLYRESVPVMPSNPVGQYLMRRGLGEVRSSALRYVPRLRFNMDQTLHPGMLAVFSDASGKASTIHRTYLTPDGKKADLDPYRMFMPGRIPIGGAIRLAPAGDTLGIAEGIENALAASRIFDMPVWAATAAGLLEKWQPPITVRHVMIFADNDRNFVGQTAAYKLAEGLVRKVPQADRLVEVLVPPKTGSDWNDVLQLTPKGASHESTAA